MGGDGWVAVVDHRDRALVCAGVLVGVELSADADDQRVARRLVELPGDGLVARRRLLGVGDEIADVEDVEVLARHAHGHRAVEPPLPLDLDLHRRTNAGSARPRIAHLQLVPVARGRGLARSSPEEVEGAEDEQGGDEQQAQAPPPARPLQVAGGYPGGRPDGVLATGERRGRLLALEGPHGLRAVAFPPLRPADFFCWLVPPCLELLRELLPEPDFLPPRLEAPGELAILAARCLDMPRFLRPSYCFSFLTLALLDGTADLLLL